MGNYLIEKIFPTSIFIKDNLLIDKLNLYKENCMNLIETKNTKNKFDGAHLTLTHGNDSLILNDSIFIDLINQININCREFLIYFGFSEEQIEPMFIQNIWINLIKKFDYHTIHTHSTSGNALISGVFYVEAPSSANLTFENLYSNYYTPNFPNLPNQNCLSTIKYQCIPGRLILFKANVRHGYDSHLSDTNKLSIAFNFGN
jgi:uncharacterized protein (TIGR02466 family)